jgi:hypothetical protein
MTAGDLVRAQDLMRRAVKQRREDISSERRDCVEILAGDVAKIIKDLRGDRDDKADSVVQEGKEDNVGEGYRQDDNTNAPNNQPLPTAGLGTIGESKERVGQRGRILVLRHEAMILRQKASTKEAQAYELEIRMLKEQFDRMP